jgi:hypothetical protein
MSAKYQQQRDEEETRALEGRIQALWPSPTGARAELEQTTRELARLRAEIRELDNPDRSRLSLFATSFAFVVAVLLVVASLLVAA